MEKLVIIDGNSLVFRAYYGVPPLSNSDGVPCNAVFGFVKMLLNVITKFSPSHMAIAFDAGKHTFRHNLYAEYKGTRKPMPDELRSQLPILKDLLKQMNITCIEIPEIEADDIIGSLSKKFDCEKILVSGDRDLLQLVGEDCHVWLTQKGLTNIIDVDPIVLKQQFGIEPYQVIEKKAIMGDASDNIPGVKGIGEKTALQLISTYENLDNIYANIDNIKGKVQTLLKEQKDLAYLSKTLATIKTDCDINVSLEDLVFDFPFNIDVKKTFEWLQFKSLMEKDEYFVKQEHELTENLQFELKDFDSIEDKMKFLSNLFTKTEIGVHFDGMAINFGVDNQEISVQGFDFGCAEIVDLVAKLLADPKINKVGFDIKSMMHKFEDFGFEINNFYDVSLAYYLCGVSDKELKFADICTNNGLSLNFPALSLLKLKQLSSEQLKSLSMEDLYYNLELKLLPVLYSMENAGITVDEQAIKELSAKYLEEVTALEKEIYDLAGVEFNIRSPKQVQDVLFDKLKLEYKGKKSTNNDVLEFIASQHPIVDKIIRHRKICKIYSTYLEGFLPLIKKGKIHTTFIQTGTVTGRLSSRDPNLQNIPVRDEEGKELRKLFTSSFDNGQIVSADYSQIELRLLAHFSEDKNLINCFNNGEDVHLETASRIFDTPLNEVTSHMRSMAKSVNFGIIYGISEFGLSKNVHISTKDAKEFIKKYFELYPTIKNYLDKNVEVATDRGYASTLLGRIRYIPELKSSNFNLRQFGQRVAMNMPLQGTASDIIKKAMINVQDRFKQNNLKSKLILQIHDELIVDAEGSEVETVSKILKEEMENVVKLNVHLTVSVSSGRSWFDAK